MRAFIVLVRAVVRTALVPRAVLLAENLALRQQLAVLKATRRRPRLRLRDRLFWVGLRRCWSGWRRALLIVQPDTVVRWHRLGFKLFWRFRSRGRRPGRPRIPQQHIKWIRRMSRDNPMWGEDRIADELELKCGVRHAESTIRNYMVRGTGSSGQTWRTFIANHASEIYACDFMTQYTACFSIVYVFAIMELNTRRIVHASVTGSPSLDWVKLQLLELSPFGSGPRFLVHDNDGIFGQFGRQRRDADGRSFRCALDMWLSNSLDVKGLPTPYSAPNANARIERFWRSLRREALNHFIFVDEAHVRCVVHEYVRFYNRARPSQAINAIPDPYPELVQAPSGAGDFVVLPVLGGVQHDYRMAA